MNSNIKKCLIMFLFMVVVTLMCSIVKADSSPLGQGYCMIISGNSDERVLDINNWNQNNGGNLETYNRNNTTNQRFFLLDLHNGYYAIGVYHSHKYLHKSDEALVSANVHQWDGYSNYNAQWKLINAGNGYYYIKCRNGGGYLDNSGGRTSPGNNVITYSFNGTAAQKWRFVSTATTSGEKRSIADGWYMIESGNSSNRVLDINNWNMNNGGNLETYQKNNTTNQQFYVKYMGNGYYSIQANHSKKYIHAQGSNSTPDNVHQWDGNSSYNAQWCIEPAGNGYYYLRCRSGNYLDNSNNSTALGNNVITYYYNGTNAQRWKFVPLKSSERYYVSTTAGCNCSVML